MKPDPIIAPVLAKLRDCMCNYLSDPATSPLSGPPCSCCIVWGEVPYLDGCDCSCTDGSTGRAYIRYVNTRGLIGPQSRCPNGLAVTIELGIVRCYTPTIEVPPCDILEGEAMGLLADMFALRRIVSCCNALPRNRWTMDDALPLGPAGGCIGASLTVTFQTPW